MPTVPTRDTQRVELQGLPSGGLSSRARAQDRGTSAISQGLSELGQIAGQVAERERDRQNSVQVMSAERAFNEFDNQRLYGEDGALRKKGRAAIGVPDEAMGDYEAKIDEIAEGLGNEEQRQAFRQVATRRLRQTQRTLLRHERQEIEAYDDAETEAFLTSSQQAASANYLDDERIDTELERQANVLRAHANRKGLPAAALDQQIAEAQSGTHSAVLNRMLGQDQYREAERYLAEKRDQLVGEQRTKAEQAVAEGMVRAEGQANADDILAGTEDQGEALAQARAIDDPDVRDETVDRLNARFQENERIRRQNERERMQNAGQIVEDTGDTGEIPVDVWSELTTAQRTTLERRARQVQDGIEPTTDWNEYYRLSGQATSDDPTERRAFQNADLMQYRDQLADTEFKELMSLQQSESTSGDQYEFLRNKNQMVDDALRAIDLTPTPDNETDAQSVRAFRSAVQNRLSVFRYHNDREPSPQEFQQALDGLLLEGNLRRDWLPDPSRRVFELEDDERDDFYLEVPEAERAKIVEALDRRGRAITDEAVQNLYTTRQLQQRGR